jgi:lysophospholipase L1-like esterase
MKFKRLSVLLTLMLAFSTFFTSFAFAENNVKPNLVALGDSITFGWNLDDTNGNANLSSKAFPNLIGNGNYNLTKNISGGGWNSTKLLEELAKTENIAALSGADVITLNIGSNDFLGLQEVRALLAPTFQALTPLEQGQAIAAAKTAALNAIPTLTNNLSTIIGSIKQGNSDATIILYNLYNPFGIEKGPLHDIGEEVINGVNLAVIQPVAAQSGSLLADAYSAINQNQSQYINNIFVNNLPFDLIHPNAAGQQKLADVATVLLAAQVPQPITVDLTASTTEDTTEPVTINISTSAKKALVVQWLKGTKSIEDFANAGNEITDKKFQITENGTYTVYVRDSKGAKAVKSIEISNIKPEEQTPTPTPAPAPTPAPTPVTSAPAPQVKATGYAIPNTASPAYNFVVLGSVVLLAGFVTLQVQRRRRQDA